MAIAMIYPDPEKLRRAGGSVSEPQEVPKARLSEARTVLKHAGDLADSVLAGSVSLDDAYKTARQRKDEATSTETQLADLRASGPWQ